MADQTSDSHRAARLIETYQEYEQIVRVQRTPSENAIRHLVTFDDNKSDPIHRWYKFKEGYSNRLLGWLQQEGIIPCRPDLRLLDPFAGVATTLLASQFQQQRMAIAVGIEQNPAIRFIGQAKLRWQDYQVAPIKAVLKQLQDDPGRGKRTYLVPNLSTFTATRNGEKRAFEPEVLQDLLYHRAWIQQRCSNTPEYYFFMLAWTAIIEAVSNTRKDGRALRLLTSVAKPSVKCLLITQCQQMWQDLEALQNAKFPTTPAFLIGGDGRRLPFGNETFNALCYSPPYLNNIDYSEVYKLELWLRGDVANPEQFQQLRLNTFRSHPSIAFPATTILNELDAKTWLRRLAAALLAAIPNDPRQRQRRVLFAGYIDDLVRMLREQVRVAVSGTPIVCVVGNSLHGGKQRIPVCTDLLVAAAAQAVGLRVDHLRVARQLPRRDHQNGWLRETIIVMHKP